MVMRLALAWLTLIFATSQTLAQNPRGLFEDLLGRAINEAQRIEQQKQQQRYRREIAPFVQACAQGNIDQCDAVLNSNPPEDIRNYVIQMRNAALLQQQQQHQQLLREQENARRAEEERLRRERDLLVQQANQLLDDCRRIDKKYCDEGASLTGLSDRDRDRFRLLKADIERQEARRLAEQRRAEQQRLERERREAEAREQRERDYRAARQACQTRIVASCHSALALSISNAEQIDIRNLLEVAESPLGIVALKSLNGIPASTLIFGATTALLSLAFLILGMRHLNTSQPLRGTPQNDRKQIDQPAPSVVDQKAPTRKPDDEPVAPPSRVQTVQVPVEPIKVTPMPPQPSLGRPEDRQREAVAMTAQPSTQSPSNLGKGLAIAAMVVVIIASLLPVPFYPYLGILGGALLASIGMVLQRDAELFGIITGIVALVGATFLSPVTFHFVKQEGALLVLIVLLIAASPLITLGLLKLKGK